MLLQFIVDNYLSFGSETNLLMTPVARERKHKSHILESQNGRKIDILPLAAVYGANGSGKSNLIKAIKFSRDFIVFGAKSNQMIKTTSFKLNQKIINEPSRFEYQILHEGTLYHYGFVVTSEKVLEEWLFATFDKKECMLFERILENGKVIVKSGEKLAKTKNEKLRIQFVAEGTRLNQLFLTEAYERNVETIKPVFEWFGDYLIIIPPECKFALLPLMVYKEGEFKVYLSNFLKNIDTGICDVFSSHETISEDDFSIIKEHLVDLGYPGVFFEKRDYFSVILKNQNQLESVNLMTHHKNVDGKDVEFFPKEESDGTQRLMHLAPILFDLQKYPKTYIVDELDRSMHPLLSWKFVETFLEGISNRNINGQFIFTTHETHLLDLDILRRDEIWFMEKDQTGKSHIASLAEYRVRDDLRIDKGYLQGRFGAIPFIGNMKSLLK